MIKRQRRIRRIDAVLREYLAAKTAAELLGEQTRMDPSYGADRGWESKAGESFSENLEATYIIRIYAEFEAALRDYWLNHRGRKTRPGMYQLINQAIPDQGFSQDVIGNADAVRKYRNFLVHDVDDAPDGGIGLVTTREAKSHLCAYLSRLDPSWR